VEEDVVPDDLLCQLIVKELAVVLVGLGVELGVVVVLYLRDVVLFYVEQCVGRS
jgi:hypothetical protein